MSRTGRRRTVAAVAMLAVLVLGKVTSTASPTVSAEPSAAMVEVGGEAIGPVAAYEQRYEEWLQSEFVRNLDLRQVPNVLLDADAPGDFPSFEAAVDASSHVVSGTVNRIACVPYGIVTFFQVDRRAKGDVPASAEIVVYQNNHLYPRPAAYPGGPFGDPVLAVDPARSLLLPGDRAVLLLTRETPGHREVTPRKAELAGLTEGTPTYGIWHQTGQYKIANGRVKREEGNLRFTDVDGMSEDALMDRATKWAKRI